MSLSGKETRRRNAASTRESLGDGEKEARRTRGRERAADKWPSRQTRNRSERARPVTCQSANSCWARRESERTCCRARGRERNDEANEGKRVTSHAAEDAPARCTYVRSAKLRCLLSFFSPPPTSFPFPSEATTRE